MIITLLLTLQDLIYKGVNDPGCPPPPKIVFLIGAIFFTIIGLVVLIKPLHLRDIQRKPATSVLGGLSLTAFGGFLFVFYYLILPGFTIYR